MIDLKPAVGRIVFGEPTMSDSFVGVYGRITRISGQRIVYQDATGRERFVYKVAAVCDTDAESLQILTFNEQARQRLINLRAELGREFYALFGDRK